MRATGFGRSSTGTRRAGKASPRTPRSRRSFRKPGLRKVRPSRRSSSASTTPSQARATPTSPSTYRRLGSGRRTAGKQGVKERVIGVSLLGAEKVAPPGTAGGYWHLQAPPHQDAWDAIGYRP